MGYALSTLMRYSNQIRTLYLSPLPTDVNAHNCANRMSDELWEELLKPLNLIDCLRLESTCAAFAKGIYAGQTRFIWNAKFQDELYDKYGVVHLTNRTAVNNFLRFISTKIGPHCRQLTLKLPEMLQRYEWLFVPFIRLESFYLHVRRVEQQFSDFLFSDPASYMPCYLYLRQLRFGIGKLNIAPPPGVPTVSERPPVNSKFLSAFSALEKLSLYRMDLFGLETLLEIRTLKNLSLICDDESLTRFTWLSTKLGSQLNKLTVKWHIESVTRDKMVTFWQAIQQFRKLGSLSLQIYWGTTDVEKELALQFVSKFNECTHSKEWPPSLRRLSLDCVHNRFQSLISPIEVIRTLTQVPHPLYVLRIVASEQDVFPLEIQAKSVFTLEISFAYLKTYREVWSVTNLNNVFPTFQQTNKFLIAKFPRSYTVRVLRLRHCPVLNMALVQHIVHYFPALEILQFHAFDVDCYHHEQRTLDRTLTYMMEYLRFLRVIELDDKFSTCAEKCSLQNTFWAMSRRAKQYPKIQYVVKFDRKSIPNLMQEICRKNIPNFRFY